MRKAPLGLRHLPQNNENYSVADDVATTTTTAAPPISQHRWTVHCVVPTNFSLCLSPSSQYWRKPYLFLWHIFGYCQLLSSLFASCLPPLDLTHSVPPLSLPLSLSGIAHLPELCFDAWVRLLSGLLGNAVHKETATERERTERTGGESELAQLMDDVPHSSLWSPPPPSPFRPAAVQLNCICIKSHRVNMRLDNFSTFSGGSSRWQLTRPQKLHKLHRNWSRSARRTRRGDHNDSLMLF